MGEIRKENLHESLVNELNELANIDLSGYQEKTDNNLVTESKDLVGAINELFQNANNGKQLIANAIGEPVSSEDTFQAMSNDINGLLSTFKTNMMNNGVAIESGDRFKQLIDKIATLADNESGGIQIASGQIDAGSYTFANVNSTHAFSFNEPLNFTPTYLFIRIPYVRYSSTNGSGDSRNAIVSNLFNDIYDGTDWAKQLRVGCISSEGILNIKSVSSSGFVMEGDTNLTFGYSSSTGYDSDYYIDWYAFGVGEELEDNTLRDSLASILQEEGVSVSTTDDMATLIGKVDQEFDRQVVPAGTAVAANVDSGKTFINSTGQLVTGTSTKVSPAGTAVAANVDSGKTFINSTGQLVTGTSTKVSPAGTAVASDVVSGKTFINSTGQLVTGTASKGLATATGTVNVSSTLYTSKSFSVNIPFTPTRLILIIPKVWYNSGVIEHTNVIVTNGTTTKLNAGVGENGTITISSMTTSSFNIQLSSLQIPSCTITWIAFG